MRKVSALAQCILALVLAIWGVKLLLPDRNVWGNPQFETLMMQCQIPSTEAIIRLYQGNGGATVAYWYSVTFDHGKFPGEKQIFHAYAYPSIQSIDCHTDGITVFTDEQDFNLTLEQIKNQLIKQPIGFYKGELQQKSIQPLRILTLSSGVLLESISVWILSRSFKQFRASRHPGHPRNSRTS
ncbi:hypothetical protein [Coleofasciculus chthonoplastes]|uniref:hypothetical protein n=1 Tax=Coleofasciculus chthonoplastes TaxID=64178 RepID=UPI0005C51B80|nr:hypothetical protein [Coleofasciculus chthonoplastes]